jgi:hypothetical protein
VSLQFFEEKNGYYYFFFVRGPLVPHQPRLHFSKLFDRSSVIADVTLSFKNGLNNIKGFFLRIKIKVTTSSSQFKNRRNEARYSAGLRQQAG